MMVNAHAHEIERLRARCEWLEAESDRRAGVISSILNRDLDDGMVERGAAAIPLEVTPHGIHARCLARDILNAALTVAPLTVEPLPSLKPRFGPLADE